jgi:hypothetical protein
MVILRNSTSCRGYEWSRPRTEEARARFMASPCAICGGQSSIETGFSLSNSVSPCQHHSINTPHSSSFTRCSYQRDKRAKRGNLPKSSDVWQNWEHWIASTFTCFIQWSAMAILYGQYRCTKHSPVGVCPVNYTYCLL